MRANTIACRLRSLRRRSGLSQIELARILGFASEVPVSRHEHSRTVPDLPTAIGYAIIFRVPVSKLFPGLYRATKTKIEARLAKLEETLHESTAKGLSAEITARKLEFLCGRKIHPSNETP